MIEKCGQMIKTFAGFLLSLGFAAAFIILLAELSDFSNYLMGGILPIVIVEVVLVIGSVVDFFLFYGLGEIVECVGEIRDHLV